MAGFDARFVTGSTIPVDCYLFGRQADRIRLDLFDHRSRRLATVSLPVQGSRRVCNPAVRRPGTRVYFFAWYVNGRYVCRVPVQVTASAEFDASASRHDKA